MTCDNRACPGCGRYAPGHYGWCTPSLIAEGCVHHATTDDLGDPTDKHADRTDDQ